MMLASCTAILYLDIGDGTVVFGDQFIDNGSVSLDYSQMKAVVASLHKTDKIQNFIA